MAEILHHLACINPVNHGINYLSTGAGFLPSTVVLIPKHLYLKNLYNFYQTCLSQDQPFFSTASPSNSLNRRNSNSSIFNGLVVNRWDLALGFQVLDGWRLLGQNETILAYDGDSFPYSLRASQYIRRCKSFIADYGHLAFLASWKSMRFSQEDIYS